MTNLLIVQGGTAKVLAGATFAEDYAGDTMVHVQGAVEAEQIVGGGYATAAGLTFTGNAYLTVDAPGATISADLVAGCSGEASTQQGNATLTLKAGTLNGTLLPVGEGTTLNGTSTLAIEGTIDLSKATVGAFKSLTLAGDLTLGEKRLPDLTLSAPTQPSTLTFTLTAQEEAAGVAKLCKAAFAFVPNTLTVGDAARKNGWELGVEAGMLVYAKRATHMWGADKGNGKWSETLPNWEDGDSVTIEAPAEGSSPREIEFDTNVVATDVALEGSNTLTGLYSLTAERLTLADGATLAFKPDPASGEQDAFSVTVGVHTLGTDITLDFSAGIVPLTAEAVEGPGATLVLPTEGVTTLTPFLVTPYSENLTFTPAGEADKTHWVVYVDGAYGVAPKPIQPIKATIAAETAWANASWTDANGKALPAYAWAQKDFEPDVELTFGETAELKFGGYTIGTLTIQPPTKANVVGSVKKGGGELHVKALVANGDVLVDKVTDCITIADGVTFVADVGGATGDYSYMCPITGSGTAMLRKQGE